MSKKFRIKSIWSPGLRGDIRFWRTTFPPQPYYPLEITIGDPRTKKDETFEVLVITPEALRDIVQPGEVVIRDRATIVVTEYDFAAIEAHLTKIVESCNRRQWSDTLQQLRRHFDWDDEWMEEGFTSI
jgi:hypothetical protein